MTGTGTGGDDLCDLCMSSGVTVDRTTYCGKTIGQECGCSGSHSDGTCGDDGYEECQHVFCGDEDCGICGGGK